MQDHQERDTAEVAVELEPSLTAAPPSTVPWDRFRSAFELAPIGMALCSPEGTYQVVNLAFCDLLGRVESDLVGSSGLDVTHPDDRARSLALVESVLEGGDERIETVKRFLRPDGEVVWAQETATLQRDIRGRPIGWIVQAQNVTDHRKATQDLRQNTHRLEEAQRIAHIGHFEWHLDTGACVWSDEMCRLMGGPPDSVKPGIAAILERVHPEDLRRVRAEFDTALAHDGAYVVDHRLLLCDESVRWAHGEGHIERDRAGVPVRMVGTIQDVTGRVETDRKLRDSELQLREAQRFESVRRLAGGIAHDFNNLLLVITGHAGLLESQFDPADPAIPEVRAITGAADRAARLTRQLLAFSRRQVFEPRVLDLNAVVGDVEKALGRMIGEDVELITVLAGDIGSIRADPGQLEQVILNLAVNARDAMPEGGSLTISTHQEFVRRADAGGPGGGGEPCCAPGPYVVLSVLDTGGGMDEETRERIFEPFFTTKERGKGTGLGLSTVQGIVKQGGGDIRVRSRLERGSCFSVYLPATEAPVESDELGPVEAAPAGGSETILVVEDDEMIRTLTMRILDESGYTVIGARSGDEALKVIEGYQAPLDLLVTDVVMPGMSGPDLVRKARTLRPEMRILYVTGYAEHPELVSRGAGGETTLLRKPFGPTELIRCVRKRLDARRHP